MVRIMSKPQPCKTIRGAVDRLIAERRELGALSTDLEVQALIAQRIAKMVDESEDPAAFTKMVAELQRALEPLGPAPEVQVDDRGPDERGRVLELLDRPAAVGDSSHS